MHASLLVLALLTGSFSALGQDAAGQYVGVDFSLDVPISLAPPITESVLNHFAFGHGPTPLELRANDVFELPRFLQPGPACEGVFALRNDMIIDHRLRNPMTVDRIDAFWMPITGDVESILVIEFYDPPLY